MTRDARELAITAADDRAAALLDAAIAAYCGLRRDAGDCLKAAISADAGLVLGHVLKGYFMLLFATRAGTSRAAAAAAAATASHPNPREAQHVAALEHWARGNLGSATQAWEAILASHPRDLLALKLAQYGRFYLGDAAAMRQASGRALAAWDAGVPGYGFALGCHAFALEECGAYGEADDVGRRALALEPADIWAAHAVTHVFEMQDRPEAGLAWIAAQEPQWSAVNNFRFHVFWHRCLFLLALGRHDEALALYDREVRAESTDEYLDIANGVSLLWRLEQAGVGVGARWVELAARARAHLGDFNLVFADLHYLMALAAAGDADGVAGWMERARAHAASQHDTAARVLAAVGLALAEAAVCHRGGDWRGAVAALLPVRGEIAAIGGSHAQRDLFAAMLIDAAGKDRPDLARALLAERRAARPNNRWGALQLARLAGG